MFMSRFFRVLLCGFVLLIASCKTDQPTAPHQYPDSDIRFVGLDSIYTGDEGSLVAAAFEVTVFTPENQPLAGIPVSLSVTTGPGIVAIRDHLTSSGGIVEALYYTTLSLGDNRVTISAVAGTDTAAVSIILHGELAPAAISLEPIRQTVRTQYAEATQAEVTAHVTNPDGIPVSDVEVAFSLSRGEAVVSGSGQTDGNGQIKATVLADGRWFGELEITASIVKFNPFIAVHPPENLIDYLTDFSDILQKSPDQPLTAAAHIVIELEAEVGLNFLTPDTTLSITGLWNSYPLLVRLADNSAAPIPGAWVSFSCDETYADIENRVLTDGNGVGSADITLKGVTGSFDVIARFEPLSLEARIRIEAVDRTPLVVELELSGDPADMWVDSTYAVRVQVQSLDGSAKAGIPVKVKSDLGNGTPEVVLTGEDGVAVAPFTPLSGGEGFISIETTKRPVTVHWLKIHVMAAPLQIADSVIEEEPGHPTWVYTYRASITDADGAPVPGEIIDAAITIGRLSTNRAVTDAQGNAVIEIHWDSGQGGIANFAVSWRGQHHEWNLPFVRHQEPASIALTADPLQLQPPGTGGDSIAVLRAAVTDRNGILIEQPVTVVFELINEPYPPRGCSINENGRIDSSVTSNGIAVASLHAGTQIGGKLIRAYTWTDSTRRDLIGTTLSTVSVVPGPPFSLDFDIDDRPDDWGGGYWRLRINNADLRVRDRNGNFITRYPAWTASVDVDFVRVEQVENSGVNLIYHERDAFRRVTVRIEIETDDGIVSAEREFALPLAGGSLQLTAEPDTVRFGHEQFIATVEIRAQFMRGDEPLPVDGLEIHFTSNRAGFYRVNPDNGHYDPYYPAPAVAITEDGIATVYLRGRQDEFFLDPFTEEVTVRVNATGYVEDIPDSSVFITVIRDAGR